MDYQEVIAREYERAYREYLDDRIILEPTSRPFSSMNEKGQVVYSLHMGQRKVMESKKRIIVAVAGRQGGKSAIGAPWLHEEMRLKGPGLYMVVAPSYPLLIDSAIPKIQELFTEYYKYGQMSTNPPTFKFTKEGERRLFRGTPFAGMRSPEPTKIRFGHAASPESLEAKTALAAWLDEAGQDGFKLASWEAIQGRLTTTLGRVLITTTPYNLGWLKTRLFDPWENSKDECGVPQHEQIDIITWKSIENPKFSIKEYETLKQSMPFWKWDMFYNGNFTVPSGLIYGVLREHEAELKFNINELPQGGTRYGGLDFGGPNTCAVLATKDPETGHIYIYDTYYPGFSMPIRQHVANLKKDNPYFDRFVGGAKSEVSFREEFRDNGLLIEEPSISDVQGGIDRLYGLIAQKKIHIASHLDAWWSEAYSYQYETDSETGDILPELKIKNKSSFHHMDATRYLTTLFNSRIEGAAARGGGERVALSEYRKMQGKATGLQEVRDPVSNMTVPNNFGNRVARSRPSSDFGAQARRPRRRDIRLQDY